MLNINQVKICRNLQGIFKDDTIICTWLKREWDLYIRKYELGLIYDDMSDSDINANKVSNEKILFEKHPYFLVS